MAQPTNTADSYGYAATNREDVHDRIYMVTPEATPGVSSGQRYKANQRAHEYLRDSLASPSATNAVIEGDDRTGTALTPPQRVGTYTQLMDKTVVVARTQQATKSIGRSDDMKREKAKKYTELKRDLEARLVSKLPAVVGSSSVARQTAGLGVSIFTNALHGSGGSTAAHNSGFATTAPTAGTARAFSEAQIKACQQSIYVNSGTMPTFAMMSPSHKAGFSAFTGIAVNRVNIKGKQQATIIGGADVYVGDFGELTIVPNYVMVGSTDVFLLDGDSYGIAYLDRFQDKPLADTGHTEKALVWCEAAVVVTTEKSVGKISDLTP